MNTDKRYMAIWFRHLLTDRLVRREPELGNIPFVLAAPERGRVMIKAANPHARSIGIDLGMVVADCRAIYPNLEVRNYEPEEAEILLTGFAEWCIRYTPVTAIDLPDGLIIDISGCTHLWGGERAYLKEIVMKLRNHGYDVRAAIADTVGSAWAVSRFGQISPIIKHAEQSIMLALLPPTALRLESNVLERMEKLGFQQIKDFMDMPRSVLRRRFGKMLLQRLDQALGIENETVQPIKIAPVYQERLPSLEPIKNLKGIEIALHRLLETLCLRFLKEGKGLKKGLFICHRIDGNVQHIEIGTNRASRNATHLFKLFELDICNIEPDLGIELFVLEAPVVEDLSTAQEAIWKTSGGKDDRELAELLDRITSKVGMDAIHRYLPDEHHWPERSIKLATTLGEEPSTAWRKDISRPLHLLPRPEAIEVMVQLPDYPPIQFSYKGELHKVKKADGPERIEREWWLENGGHRDYYCLESEKGARYWIFREGHYESGLAKWYLHGFFA